MATINPKFYRTIDQQYVINIDDISLVRYVEVNNVYDSYYLLYMRGSTNGIKITKRDGINLVNIMAAADGYGLYYDRYSYEQETSGENSGSEAKKYFAVPKEQDTEFVCSISSITSGSKNNNVNSSEYTKTEI